MDFIARIDRGRIAAGSAETHHVLLTFHAPTLESPAHRTPVNVALVLDRSGSMAGQKLELAREAIDTSLRMLRPDDRFALVVFDDAIDVVAAAAPAGEPARRAAQDALRTIGARGSTDLAGGWLRGADEIIPLLGAGRLSRVIVATDGLANQGITDHGEILRRAADLRRRGILTSTLGIGRDFDEGLLQGMADQGGGHSYYVETPRQIVDQLTSELGESLAVTMRQAVVEVRVPAGASVTLLNPFTTRVHGQGFDVLLDDLTSGQRVELDFVVQLPPAALGAALELGFALRHDGAPEVAAHAEARWIATSWEEAERAPRDADVELRAAEQMAAKAREEALTLNRAGQFGQAVELARIAAATLRPLGDANARVAGVAERLAAEMADLSAAMPAAEMKRKFYDSSQARRGRDSMGRANKSRPE